MRHVDINRLEDVPDLAPTVAKWIEAEWRRLPVHDYFDAVANRAWSERQLLPRTLVAVHNGVAIGTVSLLLDDMDTRSDLNPWLGCLYVVPDCRKHGLGTQLIQHAEGLATSLGIDLLFLFTVHEGALFSKLGWIKIGEEFYEGANSTVMKKNLVATG